MNVSKRFVAKFKHNLVFMKNLRISEQLRNDISRKENIYCEIEKKEKKKSQVRRKKRGNNSFEMIFLLKSQKTKTFREIKSKRT